MPPWRSARTLSPAVSQDEPPRVWPTTEAAKRRERRRLLSTNFASRISEGFEQGLGSSPSQALAVPFLPKDRHLASFLADRIRQDAELLEHLVHTNTEQATSSSTPVVEQLLERKENERKAKERKKEERKEKERKEQDTTPTAFASTRRSRTRSSELRRLQRRRR